MRPCRRRRLQAVDVKVQAALLDDLLLRWGKSSLERLELIFAALGRLSYSARETNLPQVTKRIAMSQRARRHIAVVPRGAAGA